MRADHAVEIDDIGVVHESCIIDQGSASISADRMVNDVLIAVDIKVSDLAQASASDHAVHYLGVEDPAGSGAAHAIRQAPTCGRIQDHAAHTVVRDRLLVHLLTSVSECLEVGRRGAR